MRDDHLQPYRRFPNLYAERKDANRLTATPFRFLDLPAALRIIIYKMALVLPQPIELWPECDTPVAAHQNTNAARNFQYLKQKLNRRHFHVALLRTCKLINSEARHIFYGYNAWRFSGVNGSMVANSFLFTIGNENLVSIRSMTLPMPFEPATFTATNLSLRGGGIVPVVSARATLRLAKQIPFDIPYPWTYSSSFYDVCAVLGKYCANLQTLNIVIPAWYDPSSVSPRGVQNVLDQLAKLQHQIVTRQGEDTMPMRICLVQVRKARHGQLNGATMMQPEQQPWPAGEFVARGWDVFWVTCDRYGRYAVPG